MAAKNNLKFQDVTFIYESSSEALFRDITLQVNSGWTGIVGPNGVGKTTLLKLATGLLEPNKGFVNVCGNSVYCPQRTDDVPEHFDEFLNTHSKTAYVIKDQLDVSDEWITRWSTLSHGERKRAQIAVALWLEPQVLAIDEPTNHIDSQASKIVTQALRSYNGIGLIVSHNRELLDLLCRQCIFIEPPDVTCRPGGVTHGMEVAKQERQALEKQHTQQKQVYKKLHREVVKRGELAKQANKMRSKRGLARGDSDGREKLNRVRVSGKDGVGGRLRGQLKGRLEQAQENLKNITVKKDYTLGIWLPGSVSKRNFILEMPKGELSLGGQKKLSYPELYIGSTDRIAIAGPNGSGKSSIIKHIIGLLNMEKEHITYVPQEIELDCSKDILAQARDLSSEKLGHLMNIVSRLGSRLQRLLDSDEPSPGEIRKLLLALGMANIPHVIILDEPTNHLDISSIECLEEALADCPCSLILISHDEYFLKKLTTKRWNIAQDGSSNEKYILHIT
ncbi:MAG: ABC-F family ATP-binding cassette domain-containing protein [Sedimentisphaerales bacterium]|nr:ABC-F family ATP-binding cassette domain-containing protein [Sedimentisphaerales bacterium]